MKRILIIIPAILLSVSCIFSQGSNVIEANVTLPQNFFSGSDSDLELAFKLKLKSVDSKDIKPLIQEVVQIESVTYFNIVATSEISKAVLKCPKKSESDYMVFLKKILCVLNPSKTILNGQKIKPCE
jgi:hypothetical protein